MPTRTKSPKVIAIQDGVAKSRYVRKGSRMKYDPNLQEILDLEGESALRTLALRFFQGFVRPRP